MAALCLTPEQEKLQAEVVSTLKSILSSVAEDRTIDEVHKDYMEIMGCPIPYKQLLHGTLASFLQSIPSALKVYNNKGKCMVKLASDGAAKHIQKMVAKQKKHVNKKMGRRPKAPRPPRNGSAWGSNHNPRFTRNRGPAFNWERGYGTGPAANLRRPLLPFPPVPPKTPGLAGPKPAAPEIKKLPLGGHKSNSSAVKSLVKPPEVSPINKNTPVYNDGTRVIPRATQQNQEKQFAPYFEVPPRFINHPTSKGAETKAQPKTYKQQLNDEVKKRNILEPPVYRTIPAGKKSTYWLSTLTFINKRFISYPEEKATAYEAEELVAKQALEYLRKPDKVSLPTTTDMRLSVNRVKEILRDKGSDTLWWHYVQELYQERYKQSLPENWIGQVQANYSTEISVIEQPTQPKSWILELPEKIYDDLKSLIHSRQEHVEIKQQKEVFNIKEDPPLQQMTTSHFIEQPVVMKHQLQHSSLRNKNDAVSNEGSKASVECCIDNQDRVSPNTPQIPSLTLPRSLYWDVYVAYIPDVKNINLRLIGEEYSGAYDDLLTNMELHYMETSNLCNVDKPEIGGVYAANHEEAWYRVKVLNVMGDEVLVLFIDHGDEEGMPLANLHRLKEEFFNLPAQNVKCLMAGLEYVGHDQSALDLLHNLALGQTLVAQVVSRSDKVSVILFNTDTDDDININEKVEQQLSLNFVEPTLPGVGGIAEVYLEHITTDGNVFVQVETETYKMLEHLLEMARSHTAMLGEDVKIDPTRLYLAQYSEDGQWYRAAPRSKMDSDGKVLMWFVDFGNSERVPSAKIRTLGRGVAERLAKIPHQALQCRLHNVPSSRGQRWTSRASKRLVELIPEGAPLLLKVQANDGKENPPLVELFKRIHPQNELVSINATLSMDSSLFSPDGDNNNNSVGEKIISPVHSRSRRSSANSHTSSSSGWNSGPSSLTSQSESNPSSPWPSTASRPESPALVPMELPRVGDFFDVFVTYAASPSNFAVQSWKMTPKLETLMDDLQMYFANPNNIQDQPYLEAGGVYAVKHTDNMWYRAHLVRFQQGLGSGLFVDYGDCFCVTQEYIQPLPLKFLSLPCQAIKAKLGSVTPANKDWTPDDSIRFRDLVENHEFVSVVIGIEQEKDGNDGDSVLLLLRLIDTRDPTRDLYIDKILAEEGRAKMKENA